MVNFYGLTNFLKLNKSYTFAEQPTLIPVPGNKTIAEYIGRLNTGMETVSVARMEAPPGWSEPEQTPEFDEITILLEGKMTIAIDGEEVILRPGNVIVTHKGKTVRYSNPFESSAVYWAICVPAFSPETVNRKD